MTGLNTKYAVCEQCSDGLYLYSNLTNSGDYVYSCVQDWSLANSNYVNNPSTRTWEYWGNACTSCSSKYGCEKCEGLEFRNSVTSTTFNLTGYNTNFTTCNRCYTYNSICEECQNLDESTNTVEWTKCGYSINDDICNTWSSNTPCAAYCSSNCYACDSNYFLSFQKLTNVNEWFAWSDSFCKNWDGSGICSLWTDGYSLGTNEAICDLEWTSETYYFGDWAQWYSTPFTLSLDQCERCKDNLILK